MEMSNFVTEENPFKRKPQKWKCKTKKCDL